MGAHRWTDVRDAGGWRRMGGRRPPVWLRVLVFLVGVGRERSTDARFCVDCGCWVLARVPAP